MHSKQNDSGRNRFVAFVDILGFRDLVLRSPDLSDFSERYTRVFAPLEDELQRYGILHRLFSDSLFLCVQHRALEQELRNLIMFCRSLLRRATTASLPIRGSISFGRVIWNKNGDIIVGAPIIESVEYERIQNWVGIILAPTSTRYLAQKKDLMQNFVDERLLRKYRSVPVKGTPNTMSALAIDFSFSEEEKNEQLTHALDNMGLQSGSSSASFKYLNTINFLEEAKAKPGSGAD